MRRDPEVAFWWGAPLSCMSALAAAQRRGRVDQAGCQRGRGVLDHLQAHALEVQPTNEVRARALRLVSVHPLRAEQALELAAALVWCRERTSGVGFVSLESSLRLAAVLEGFRVLPLADEVHEPEPEL